MVHKNENEVKVKGQGHVQNLHFGLLSLTCITYFQKSYKIWTKYFLQNCLLQNVVTHKILVSGLRRHLKGVLMGQK